jgi:hypothetical protein
MTRLTPAQRTDRALSEDDFRAQVDDLAYVLGWQWMTVGPLRTQHGWRTPTRGPLGAGWPDTVYVQPYRGRLLFVEFKRELGKTSPEQDHVHRLLRAAGLTVAVWRPSDLTEGRIQEALR